MGILPYLSKANPKTLHRLIVGAKPGDLIDHKNGEKLDCRRDNLRKATYSENGHNKHKKPNTSSKYIGVSKTGGAYFGVEICQDGKRYYGGCYKQENVAAWSYDQLATMLYGAFAKLSNVILHDYVFRNNRATYCGNKLSFKG